MTTRDEESMNLFHQSPQLPKTRSSTLNSETMNDEIAVDVPLPEEPAEMSGRERSGLDHRRSTRHSLAWRATSATAQGGKDEPLVTCRKNVSS